MSLPQLCLPKCVHIIFLFHYIWNKLEAQTDTSQAKQTNTGIKRWLLKPWVSLIRQYGCIFLTWRLFRECQKVQHLASTIEVILLTQSTLLFSCIFDPFMHLTSHGKAFFCTLFVLYLLYFCLFFSREFIKHLFHFSY